MGLASSWKDASKEPVVKRSDTTGPSPPSTPAPRPGCQPHRPRQTNRGIHPKARSPRRPQGAGWHPVWGGFGGRGGFRWCRRGHPARPPAPVVSRGRPAQPPATRSDAFGIIAPLAPRHPGGWMRREVERTGERGATWAQPTWAWRHPGGMPASSRWSSAATPPVPRPHQPPHPGRGASPTAFAKPTAGPTRRRERPGVRRAQAGTPSGVRSGGRGGFRWCRGGHPAQPPAPVVSRAAPLDHRLLAPMPPASSRPSPPALSPSCGYGPIRVTFSRR